MTLKPTPLRIAITLAFMVGGAVAHGASQIAALLLSIFAAGMSSHARILIIGLAAAAACAVTGWAATSRLAQASRRLYGADTEPGEEP